MSVKNHLSRICLALLTSFICCSCASLPAKNAPQEPGLPAEKRAGEVLLKAFVRNTPETFLAQLPESVRNEFGTNGFKKTRAGMIDQLGTPVAYSFVTNLQHPAFTVSIWKIRFVRKSSDGKREITQEAMFRAVSGKLDGKERLLGFNFF